MKSFVISGKRNHSSLGWLSAASIAIACCLAAPKAQSDESEVSLDIPSQMIVSALMNFAEQTDVNLLYSAQDLGNQVTKEVKGDYTPAEGLEVLLDGTGIGYKFNSERTATIGTQVSQLDDDTNTEEADSPDTTDDNNDEQSSIRNETIRDEVIVTAAKREQALQDVPFSVTALTADALDSIGADDFADYAFTVPSLGYQDGGPSRRSYNIRGVGSELAGVSTVGVYIDDIPITDDDFNADLKVFDVERIEILRGPQGTLYGEGSMGGTIKFVTAKPDATQVAAKADIEVSTTASGGENFLASGMVNVPIVKDVLAVRAVAYYRDLEGWIDNIQLGQENVNDEETIGGRVAARLNLGPDTRATATVIYQDSEFGGRNFETLGAGDLNQIKFFEEPIDDEHITYNLTLEHSVGPVDLVSSTSYFDREFSAIDDVTFNNGVFPDLLTAIDFERNIFTQELRMLSQFDGPFQFLLGGYYTDREEKGSGLTESSFFANAFLRETNFEFKQWAIFGELYWDITPDLHLVAGARYFDEERDDTTTLSGVFAFFPGTTAITASENGVTPKFVLSYDIVEDIMVYALASKGFRSGGPNNQGGLFALAPPQFNSDTIWNYEAGLKSAYLGGDLIVNGAFYYIDWNDIQVTNPVPQAFFITNAGKAHSTGVELEVLARPIEGLELGFAGAYTAAKLDEDNPLGTTGGVDGSRLPFVPRYTANISVQYTTPVFGEVDVVVRGDLQAIGNSVNSVNPMTLERQGSYELANFRAGLQSANWEASIFVENAFDERAVTQSAILFSNGVFRNRPRTAGLNFKARF